MSELRLWYEVRYKWMIAAIADRFHVLPTVVAREMDADPAYLCSAAVSMLAYAEAHRVFKNANHKTDLKGWENSTLMDAVQNTTFRRKHDNIHPTFTDDCPRCVKRRDKTGLWAEDSR